MGGQLRAHELRRRRGDGRAAHDERDFAFAKKPTAGRSSTVVSPVAGETYSTDAWQEWYGEKGSGRAASRPASSPTDSASKPATAINRAWPSSWPALAWAIRQTTWRLRDWGISRQRYWGTPIPIIHCEPTCPGARAGAREAGPAGGAAGRPDPSTASATRSTKHAAFDQRADCPTVRRGPAARRETDTMDTFVDSVVVLHRAYLPDSGTPRQMVDRSGTDYWMPMDQYIGGIEHAILHLLYCAFLDQGHARSEVSSRSMRPVRKTCSRRAWC